MIEVFQQPDGLSGEPEVWVKVLANEALDWPSVEAKLDADAMAILRETQGWKDHLGSWYNGTRRDAPSHALPNRYHPHLVTKDERDDHGFAFEDWWVFLAKGSASWVQ